MSRKETEAEILDEIRQILVVLAEKQEERAKSREIIWFRIPGEDQAKAGATPRERDEARRESDRILMLMKERDYWRDMAMAVRRVVKIDR